MQKARKPLDKGSKRGYNNKAVAKRVERSGRASKKDLKKVLTNEKRHDIIDKLFQSSTGA